MKSLKRSCKKTENHNNGKSPHREPAGALQETLDTPKSTDYRIKTLKPRGGGKEEGPEILVLQIL